MDEVVAEWVRIARRDAKLARIALDSGDPENALYLCQQALEKALKGHIQADNNEPPPKTHKLPRLAAMSGFWGRFSEEHRALLTELSIDAVTVRYGTVEEPPPPLPKVDEAADRLRQVEEVLEWLFQELK